MANKYKAIASLEKQLKEVETEYCFAEMHGDREAMENLYVQRGVIIRELQRVR